MNPSLLPRFLFLLTITAALGLIVLVIAAPVLDNKQPVVAVFAQDVTLRRTALASALGLLVTACVFFRVPSNSKKPAKSTKLPPPPDIAGA